MKNLIKITLSLTLLATLTQAKIYEDAEDGNTQGWRIFDNTPSGATISNIEENGNRVIKLSGDITRNAYIIGGTSKISDKAYKWDAREGSKLSFKIKFDLGQRPEILVAIRPAHQSDKIRYIRYRSSTRHDENGWNRSGSILSIKLDKSLENGEWFNITRDLEKDLQTYRHPFDPTQNRIVAVNGMIIYGSALVDDIQIEGSHETLTMREPLIPTNCKGEIIKKGLDLNDNGILEASEVSSTQENYTEGTPITRDELKVMIVNNEDVTSVNTCKITDMSRLFAGNMTFDQDIGGWNTGRVTNMQGMFDGADNFDQPIGEWDVSKVTDMSDMFNGAIYFNQPIGDWNISKVTKIKKMFANAMNFDQTLKNWDVSNITDMSEMFYGTIAFNSSLNKWDVSHVSNMKEMFQESWFNGDISDWNVSNVSNMQGMFSRAQHFDGDIGNWDVSNVSNMSGMFYWAISFSQPIGDWNVSNVTNMSWMFHTAGYFNENINNWDVSNVIDMEKMFYGAIEFSHCIDEWNLSNSYQLSLRYFNNEGEEKLVYDQTTWNAYVQHCQDISNPSS